MRQDPSQAESIVNIAVRRGRWLRSTPGFLLVVAVILSVPFQRVSGADEVWAYIPPYNVIDHYNLSGANQGTYNALNRGDYKVAMAVVEDEVWTYVPAYRLIDRYSFTGGSMGSYTAANRDNYPVAMAVVGNFVWAYLPAYNVIDRYNFDGVHQGTYAAPNRGNYSVAMAVVGTEVWAYIPPYNVIDHYNFNGVHQGTYTAPNRGDYKVAMTVVGNEVWAYLPAYNVIDRYNFSGVNQGTHPAVNRNDYPVAMVNTGTAIWAYLPAYGVIDRYSLAGANQGTYPAPNRGNYSVAMAVILQPDCNSNGHSDYDDITAMTSIDCNANLKPDECEISIASSAPGGPYYCTQNCASDCNNDGIPDLCQTDCNNNDIPDDCDLMHGTSEDCNTNSAPDSCDIAGPVSDDCNTDQIPDECDIAAATSDDCNANDVADECEAGSGDIYWAGSDGAEFDSAANWSPATVPSSAGNALIENAGPSDNRCIVAGTSGPLCSISVSASGSGRQILQINDGVVLETNSGTSVSPGGDIRLLGGELAGGPVANTSDSISGFGDISANLINAGHVEGDSFRLLRLSGATLDNQSGGRMVAPLASGMEVLSANVQQAGEIEIHAIAACRMTPVVFNAAGGVITLFGGAIGSHDPAGLVNSVGGLVIGTGTLDCPVANEGEMVVIADTLVVGDLTNNGTVTIQSGLLTVTGDVEGSGIIIGGMGGRDGQSGGMTVAGNYLPSTTDWRGWDLSMATLEMNGGEFGRDQLLEVVSADRGVDRDFSDPACRAIGTLRIGPAPTSVRLADRFRNVPGSRTMREALYVRRLVLEPGATLDLAGQRLFAEEITPRDPRAVTSGVGVIDSVGGGALLRRDSGPAGARKLGR